MPGKTDGWSWEEIRTVTLYLNAVGLRDEEIYRSIWAVCGRNSVSKEQVYHILAADKQTKVPFAGREDPLDVLSTEDDIEISNFLELYSENIVNYSVPSSKYQRNQWNPSRQELYSREQNSRSKVEYSRELGDEVLRKKLEDIINNFSHQNFTVTASEIKNLGVTTEGSVNKVIDIVFEKAVENFNFSIPYANFCMRLSLLKIPRSGQAKQLVDIGELLLTKCQEQFEKNEVSELGGEEISRPVQDEKKQLENIPEEKQKNRRQLGTARFMGWLFKLDILTECAMHQVIEKLLFRDDEIGAKCVCVLIAAIGSDLNSDKIENYISDLKKISEKQCVSAKLKNILQHISNLKMNSWVSHGEKKSIELIDDILNEDQEEIHQHKNMSLQVEYSDSVSDDNVQQEDDSSRLIPEGKRQYDREFLLNLQSHPLCKQKPLSLPNIDAIIKNNLVPYGEKGNARKRAELQVDMNRKQNMPLQISLAGRKPDDVDQQKSHLSPQDFLELKHYSRNFLLNLQYNPESMKKPADLPDLSFTKFKCNWVPRHGENNSKTTNQIHKAAQKEAHEQQMLHQMKFPKRMPDVRDKQKNRSPMRKDGAHMSGKGSKVNYSIDPMKLKLIKPCEVESIQLGPGGKFSISAKDHSGGTKSSSIEQDSKPAPLQSNRYTSTDI